MEGGREGGRVTVINILIKHNKSIVLSTTIFK